MTATIATATATSLQSYDEALPEEIFYNSQSLQQHHRLHIANRQAVHLIKALD